MAQPTRSPSTTPVLVVGALIASALTLGVFMHRRGAPPANASQPASAAIVPGAVNQPTTDPRIALLQAQIAGLSDRLNESERRANAPRDVPPSAAPESQANLEQAAPERTWTDGPTVNHRYDQRFEAQPVDGAWATTETRSLRAFIDSSAPSAKIEALECRSSMCRARLGFADRKDRQAFLTSVTSPDFAPAAYVNSDAEQGKVTLFTARAGQDLPDVSNE